MHILLLGYGKMGKTLYKLAEEKGYQVSKADNPSERDVLKGIKFNVAIEFSQPDAAFENIIYCIEQGIPVVSGTTGWLDKKQEAEEYCRKKGGTLFYASNFSIGVNLFFKLNEWMARLMNDHQDYDISMEEIHHIQKLDSPSGTAITIAEGIIGNNDLKKHWSDELGEVTNLRISSKREGNIPGTHIVRYISEMDTIELKHTAHTRESFARGALMVAEWVTDKRGVLNMNDFMNA